MASFSKSEKGDSLSQFRAYGNYCIGFDAKKLKSKRATLYRCVYKNTDIKKWIVRMDKLKEWRDPCLNSGEGADYRISAFADVLFARFAKLKNEHYKSEKEVRLLTVSSCSWDHPGLQMLYCEEPAIYFRHDDFFDVPIPYVKFFIPEEEKSADELEAMVVGKSQIEAKQIIREMEEKQERKLLPITEVVIGPMQHQEDVVAATRIFLLEKGYENVDIKSSNIPFRGN